MADTITRCLWSCARCQQHGASRPWVRNGETTTAAVARFERETRDRCSRICQFVAVPDPPPPAVSA